MSDCFSLPNAAKIAELQSFLKLYAISPDATFHAPKYAEAMEKAADVIEALMQENAKLKSAFDECYAANEDLFAKLETMKEERDAAVADINKYCRFCIICKHAKFTEDYRHNFCGKCLDEDNRCFEWRGVQKEEEDGKIH